MFCQGARRLTFIIYLKQRKNLCFIPYMCQAPADIPITIRRSVIHIQIEPAIISAIIPITAQFSYTVNNWMMVF